ncbi:MAG: hypothetical protein IIC49_02475 [Planctomycetes bacterium]|nr:hypothetical protein [Planctomycetota bacterium]
MLQLLDGIDRLIAQGERDEPAPEAPETIDEPPDQADTLIEQLLAEPEADEPAPAEAPEIPAVPREPGQVDTSEVDLGVIGSLLEDEPGEEEEAEPTP